MRHFFPTAGVTLVVADPTTTSAAHTPLTSKLRIELQTTNLGVRSSNLFGRASNTLITGTILHLRR
jgi:hypothetical protein